MFSSVAQASIVPTVPLASTANYAVLGGSTVTNTGNSVLNGSLGLSPGTSITGFPPGIVNAPGTTNKTNAVALQAQNDLTTAYVNAAGRSVDATVAANLANQNLQAGVYSASGKGALLLSGPLTLDGAGNPNSVFIFQTNSTLTTGSGSRVTLINGAQECNVFWQIGSSATLGSGSVFVGNILALASITVNNSVTVHGRALARTAAVTLDNDVFTRPKCDLTSSSGGSGGSGTTPATIASGGSNGSGSTTVTTKPAGSVAASSTGTQKVARPRIPSGLPPSGPGIPGISGPPQTGVAPVAPYEFPWVPVLLISLAALIIAMGAWYQFARKSFLHTRDVTRTFITTHRVVSLAMAVVMIGAISSALIYNDADTKPFKRSGAAASLSVKAKKGTELFVPAALTDGIIGLRDGTNETPLEIKLPTVRASADIIGVGVTKKNAMSAPMGKPDDPVWHQAFWYRGSAIPGAPSTALIAAHVNGPKGIQGPFAHLKELKIGDPIVIRDTRTGTDMVFKVTVMHSYPLSQTKDKDVLTAIYGEGPVAGTEPVASKDGLAHISLITCDGVFVNGTHDHRLLVQAIRIS